MEKNKLAIEKNISIDILNNRIKAGEPLVIEIELKEDERFPIPEGKKLSQLIDVSFKLDGQDPKQEPKLMTTKTEVNKIRYEIDTKHLSPDEHILSVEIRGALKQKDKIYEFEEGNREKLTSKENSFTLQTNSSSPPASETSNTLEVKLIGSKPALSEDMVLWGLIKSINNQFSFDAFVNEVKKANKRINSFKDLLQISEDFLRNNVISLATDDQIGPGSRMPEESVLRSYELTKLAQQLSRKLDSKNLQASKDLITEYASSLVNTGNTMPFIYALNKGEFKPYELNKMGQIIEDGRGDKLAFPLFIELIWSYWHEESMLLQTIKVISLRFQNAYSPTTKNQLVNFTTDPLKSLSNILWDYVKYEDDLLSVRRRAFEYDQHYGLKLYGKATENLRSVDSRSKFLEAFHSLLHICCGYFKEVDDTTVVADPFPVKNALRELHLVLSEGGTNQYGDLPWTSRVEMYTIKWILGQPEMKDFLRGRPMVRYQESWMEVVDTMKKLQGWNDTSVSHFFELATMGEQILLSVRFGDWNSTSTSRQEAENWVLFWRDEIQSYIHAYRIVTGIDLTKGVNTQMPGQLIKSRTVAVTSK